MEDRELIDILDGLITSHVDESEILEYKSGLSDPVKLGQYISSISNSAALRDEKRGYIFWGIEDGTLRVIGTDFNPKTRKAKNNEDLTAWLSQKTGRKDFEFRNLTYKGKNIVVLIIPASKWDETKFDGVAYIRINSNNVPLDKVPERKRMLWRKLVSDTFEAEIALSAITRDQVLRLLNYDVYYQLLSKDIPANTEDIMTMLLHEKCISRESKVSSLYNITNLGAILFAKDLDDFDGLRNKAIRVIRYSGINRLNAINDYTVNEGYVTSFFKLLTYIENILPQKETFVDGVRTVEPAYPPILLRELIPNAMIHQDFLIRGQQPRIEIFDDRIEITNTGEPMIPVTRFLDMTPVSRNEELARMMHKLRICEERGSGIDRVILAVEQYKLPAPVFKSEHASLIATVFLKKPLENLSKEEKINMCYQHCCYLYYMEHLAMTNQSLRERMNADDIKYTAISRIIADTKKAELIRSSENNTRKYIPFWAI